MSGENMSTNWKKVYNDWDKGQELAKGSSNVMRKISLKPTEKHKLNMTKIDLFLQRAH